MKEVWYVAPDTTLFDTKIAAERFARQLHPDEPIERREARIRYREVFSEEDLKK